MNVDSKVGTADAQGPVRQSSPIRCQTETISATPRLQASLAAAAGATMIAAVIAVRDEVRRDLPLLPTQRPIPAGRDVGSGGG
jgi:hypothetical protein